MTAALIGFTVLLLLIFMRMPIAFAMGIVGFGGLWYIDGLEQAAVTVAFRFEGVTQNYELAVLPMFILMGNLVAKAGMSRELYDASNAFLGHRRGGLSMATVVACGGFSAICGSSLATAATMSKVAMPSMRRYGYSDSLATASIAAGGTLGILIPPSVILVIYGIMTESSIRELFAAGFLPGLLGILLYLAAVQYTVLRNPGSGPRGERLPWAARLDPLLRVSWTLALFVLVMGGIYVGFFTPNEAAGVGAFGAFLIMVARRFDMACLGEALADGARTTLVFIIALVLIVFAVDAAGIELRGINATRSLHTALTTPVMISIGTAAALIVLALGCRAIGGGGAPLKDLGVWRWAPRLFWGIVLADLVVGGAVVNFAGLEHGAAAAAAMAVFIGVARHRFIWPDFSDTLIDATRTAATLFIVLIGALVFSNFVNVAGLPSALKALVSDNNLSPIMVVVVIMLIYIVLGCVFESLSMLLLTIPVFFPVIQEIAKPVMVDGQAVYPLGVEPRWVLIWFGILAVVVTEISLITPPVGLNVFVLSGVLRDVKTTTIFKGVTPFWVADIIRLAILLLIPWVSVLLPRLFYDDAFRRQFFDFLSAAPDYLLGWLA